jgi:hypothetical protein
MRGGNRVRFETNKTNKLWRFATLRGRGSQLQREQSRAKLLIRREFAKIWSATQTSLRVVFFSLRGILLDRTNYFTVTWSCQKTLEGGRLFNSRITRADLPEANSND